MKIFSKIRGNFLSQGDEDEGELGGGGRAHTGIFHPEEKVWYIRGLIFKSLYLLIYLDRPEDDLRSLSSKNRVDLWVESMGVDFLNVNVKNGLDGWSCEALRWRNREPAVAKGSFQRRHPPSPPPEPALLPPRASFVYPPNLPKGFQSAEA